MSQAHREQETRGDETLDHQRCWGASPSSRVRSLASCLHGADIALQPVRHDFDALPGILTLASSSGTLGTADHKSCMTWLGDL